MNSKIRDILMLHRGKENPVTSKEISQEMGFSMEDTQAFCRKAIRETAKEYGLPLVSSNKGYFLANTDEELEIFNKNIEKRIKGMEKSREMANKNYREWKK